MTQALPTQKPYYNGTKLQFTLYTNKGRIDTSNYKI